MNAADGGRFGLVPVFVLGPPRSGITLAGEALEETSGIWSRPPGDRDIFEGLVASCVRDLGDRLTPSHHLAPEVVEELLLRGVRDHLDRPLKEPSGPDTIVVDASVRHALRVGFLAKVFPTSVFIVVDRSPLDAVSSLIEVWEGQRHASQIDLPGWTSPRWTYPLVPGWDELRGLPLAEIAARQWIEIVGYLGEDLSSIDRSRWAVLRYEDLCRRPADALQEVFHRFRIPVAPAPKTPLPLSRETISTPQKGKWRDLHPELPQLLTQFSEELERWTTLMDRDDAGTEPEGGRGPKSSGQPLGRQASPRISASTGVGELVPASEEVRFEVTGELPDFLGAHQASLITSTYRSGRLISFGAPEGELLCNAIQINAPMGIAVKDDVIAVGTQVDLVTFRNDPAAARAVGPPYDACFLPRTIRFTGEMGVRELVFVGDELWATSSRFSCLVRMATDFSFEPRWYPPFISRLVNEDRCHLNGIATRGGVISHATCLGESDSPEGWRDRKADGGVLIEVASGETVVRGLSMPHSPRWYRDRLWVLESGKGNLVTCDPRTGELETVAHVPGFARGLSFLGDHAVIGLSHIRESVFRGLPIVEDPNRQCAIWIVHLETGKPVGTIRFEGIVQELFDVAVVAGARYSIFPRLDSALNKTSFLIPPTSVVPMLQAVQPTPGGESTDS